MKKILILPALLAAACSEPSISTTFTVQAYVQQVKEEPEVPAVDAVGYAFFTDTSYYHVTSLEDALAGVMTARDGSGTRQADMVLPNNAGTLTSEPITSEILTLVVADQAAGMYAVALQPMAGGLPEMIVPLHFKPYKLLAWEKSGRWFVFGEFPAPPEEPEEPEEPEGPEEP